MKTITLAATAGFCLTATPASAQDALTAEAFVEKAALSNSFEIATSDLAVDEADDDAVEDFARQMLADHARAGEELAAVLEAEGMEMPPTALPPEKAQRLAELEEADDEAFDRLYVTIQLQAHEEAVALFSGYAQDGENAALKDFATRTLPVLEQHLQHVQQLAAR